MISSPKVSIIVTTYNREQLLAETIEGILNQTFQDFELIIVDNNSSYNILQLIEKFNSNKIKFFQNNNNGVIAVNRNFGIEKAIGKYIAFCDDDDIWKPNKLELQIQEAEKHSENILIYTNATCFGEGVKKFPITNYSKRIKNLNDLFSRNSITLSTVLVTNSKLVYFNTMKELIAVEDYYLWLNLIVNNYNIVFVNKELLNYRIDKKSVSNTFRKINNLKFILAQSLIFINYNELKFSKIKMFYFTIINNIKYLLK